MMSHGKGGPSMAVGCAIHHISQELHPHMDSADKTIVLSQKKPASPFCEACPLDVASKELSTPDMADFRAAQRMTSVLSRDRDASRVKRRELSVYLLPLAP